MLLIALLFVPFGMYHSTADPYVWGLLWGFNLPIGYVGLLLGALTILYARIGPIRNRLRFSSFVVVIGILLAVLVWLSPAGYFANLLRGTSFTDTELDLDYAFGYGATFWLGVATVVGGLLMKVSSRSGGRLVSGAATAS